MSAYVATEDVSTLSRRKSNLFPREVRKVLWNYLSLRLLGLLVLIGFSLIFVVAKLAWVNVFLWVSGLIVGWMVFEIDYLLRFVFYNSNENNAMAKNDLIRGQGKLFWELFINEMNLRSVSVIRSVLFQVVVGLLSLYIIFSSNYLFAQGLVLAMGGRIVLEQVFDWWRTKNVDNWFWQVDMEISRQFKDLWILGWLVIWFALVWWMI